jgi:hypothetical protein
MYELSVKFEVFQIRREIKTNNIILKIGFLKAQGFKARRCQDLNPQNPTIAFRAYLLHLKKLASTGSYTY